MKRKNGYYKVELRHFNSTRFVIAEFCEGYWYLTGIDDRFLDIDLVSIDETCLLLTP